MSKPFFIAALLFSLGVFTSSFIQASPLYIMLSGKVTLMSLHDSSEKGLAGVPVEIWANGELVETIRSGPKGKYTYKLPYYANYTIKFGAYPLIKKMIEIDATDFARDTQNNGFSMIIDVSLFTNENNVIGLDFLTKTPIGKASYNKKARTTVWDEEHTEQVNRQLLAILNNPKI